MSKFLNPGNGKFQESIDSAIYVDKTGLIEYTNSVLSKRQKYICISRPRRFGKSMAAEMIEAYYCRTCDSHTQFDGLAVSKSDTYEKHINKYNVVHINIVDYINRKIDTKTGLAKIEKTLISNLKNDYPDIEYEADADEFDMIDAIYYETKTKFVFIIDEWDCPFRERKSDTKGIDDYLVFLNTLMKDKEYVALAYMTGILPIKKTCTNSSLNMFSEFSVLAPGPVKYFFGFTGKEVAELCTRYKRDIEKIRDWYDGYIVGDTPEDLHIYNSNSVVSSLLENDLLNYWPNTESYEDLKQYIQTDIGGLHDVLIKLIGGEEYELKTTSFSNDLVTTDKLKDILITLTHLGYLSYNKRTDSVMIPNHEIRIEFVDTILEMEGTPLEELMKDSMKLLDATIDKDEGKVCELIKKIHLGYSSLKSYKDEGTLTAIVRYAYIYALGKYKVIPEAEAGDGYSDLVLDSLVGGKYVPLIIELEHNRSAEAAIKQIKDTNYVDYFVKKGHKGTVLYVGINYKNRKGLPRSRGVFTCKIEAEEI